MSALDILEWIREICTVFKMIISIRKAYLVIVLRHFIRIFNALYLMSKAIDLFSFFFLTSPAIV